MLKIGLTGGIGSGKSTVAQMFSELGVPVYTADQRAKTLQNQEPLKSKISQLFGSQLYKNEQLDRKMLAEIVFNNKQKLEQLNQLVHPAVAQDFENWLLKKDAPYIIKEAAIIFEIKAERQYDKIILVTAPENVRISRVIDRDKSNIEQVKARIINQLSDSEKIKKADFIIENTDLLRTKAQVFTIHKSILELL